MKKPSSERRSIAQAMRAFADLLERADAAQLNQIPHLLDRLAFDLGMRNSAQAVDIKVSAKRTVPPLSEVVKRISSANSREEGYRELDSFHLSRKGLEAVARLATVHLSRSDDIEVMREKIVESIVGTKLNARAIRGYD